jgi:hypothetical protein
MLSSQLNRKISGSCSHIQYRATDPLSTNEFSGQSTPSLMTSEGHDCVETVIVTRYTAEHASNVPFTISASQIRQDTLLKKYGQLWDLKESV